MENLKPDLNDESLFSKDPVKRVEQLEAFLTLLLHRVITQQDQIDSLQDQLKRRA